MRLAVVCFIAFAVMPSLSRAQAPVIVISPEGSTVKFSVKATVPLKGNFGKWDATLTFTSPDVTTGILDINIQAATVITGSKAKDNKLKSKDFFNAKKNPLITFVSKQVVQTGPDTFDVQGDFTLRGVTKSETLKLKIFGKGTGSGEVKGTMAFDRRDYGMNSGIPFIRIADRIEVTVDLKAKQISGPRLVYQQ